LYLKRNYSADAANRQLFGALISSLRQAPCAVILRSVFRERRVYGRLVGFGFWVGLGGLVACGAAVGADCPGFSPGVNVNVAGIQVGEGVTVAVCEAVTVGVELGVKEALGVGVIVPLGVSVVLGRLVGVSCMVAVTVTVLSPVIGITRSEPEEIGLVMRVITIGSPNALTQATRITTYSRVSLVFTSPSPFLTGKPLGAGASTGEPDPGSQRCLSVQLYCVLDVKS